MGLAPDPADKGLDAQADGAFGGKQDVNRRAGYGDQLDRILSAAWRGHSLGGGEGLQLIKHFEALVEQAYSEGLYDSGAQPAPSSAEIGQLWKHSLACEHLRKGRP